ncbi:Tubby-like F-box protein [Rhynchospora pubera]|uniref:Tubby-like F-box protein n=1 Tax=Rhynchospora pubera TaxID=906938 RepID=A0AAV8H2F3_9POAL|nr:Tubby-like F-box protein [Rhynchospora pubera]
MSLKSIVRELKEMKEGMGNISKRGEGRAGHSRVASQTQWPNAWHRPNQCQEEIEQTGNWAHLPPELLFDIVQRVEDSEVAWPERRNVVACAAVCRSWRCATKEAVKTLQQCARFTFPVSLKQPAPRDHPIQCFVRRDRATSTFRLYLGLSPSLHGENDKLLMAARKVRRATGTDFVISLASDDFSRNSNTYVGKLRSNFLGTKFTIFDSQPPSDAVLPPTSRITRNRINSKQVSPRLPAGNYEIATIAYELNMLRTRGPRRMHCTMHHIPLSSLQADGTAPTPTNMVHGENPLEEQFTSMNLSQGKGTTIHAPDANNTGEPLVLKNKAPRWHEQLQCWCLNFRGRVTVASVKNFQLVAAPGAADLPTEVPPAELEKVILQFGKIGKDIFTMDYRYPLSAFQAFAICLTSFDTKPACE